VTDPYLDHVYRWWHLSVPSPELIEAEAESWLGAPGTAVDIGCGAGTELAYLGPGRMAPAAGQGVITMPTGNP